MAREFSRKERVADFIRRELAQLIQMELKDPRLGMINIVDVDVSRDLSVAKVYFTIIGGGESQDKKQAETILTGAAGFLRNQLAAGSAMRSTPRLQFYHDDSVENGQNLSKLIDSAVASDAEKQHTAEE